MNGGHTSPNAIGAHFALRAQIKFSSRSPIAVTLDMCSVLQPYACCILRMMITSGNERECERVFRLLEIHLEKERAKWSTKTKNKRILESSNKSEFNLLSFFMRYSGNLYAFFPCIRSVLMLDLFLPLLCFSFTLHRHKFLMVFHFQ